jgi:hypothetical protein
MPYLETNVCLTEDEKKGLTEILGYGRDPNAWLPKRTLCEQVEILLREAFDMGKEMDNLLSPVWEIMEDEEDSLAQDPENLPEPDKIGSTEGN